MVLLFNSCSSGALPSSYEVGQEEMRERAFCIVIISVVTSSCSICKRGQSESVLMIYYFSSKDSALFSAVGFHQLNFK